jgi:hypothetical protein
MAEGPQKTSGLAIASLVCSLICCIPVIPVIGILLGIGAMISIGGDPAKKGKGMAVTGIVLGVIFTVGQGVFCPWLYGVGKEFYAFVGSGPNDALVAGFDGDAAGFKGQFHGAGATASDAEVRTFIRELRSRYGGFVSCCMDEQAPPPQGTFGKPIVPFPYVYEFENAQMRGEAELAFSDPAKGGFFKKIASITIFDDERGDLTYPAAAALEEALEAEPLLDEAVEEMIEEAIEELPEVPAEEPAEVPTEGDAG